MILEVLEKWEPLWLLIVLLAGLGIEFHSNYMLRKEYEYDKHKDDMKSKKTRTTKKTTTQPSGVSVVEESVETSEPVQSHEQK